MLNTCMLIGNLGAAPLVHDTDGGHAVTTVSVATNEYWFDKQGAKQQRTEWHDVVLFDRLAKRVAAYPKGTLVYVEGRLQRREWMDDLGAKHYRTEIVARTLRRLSKSQKPAAQRGA